MKKITIIYYLWISESWYHLWMIILVWFIYDNDHLSFRNCSYHRISMRYICSRHYIWCWWSYLVHMIESSNPKCIEPLQWAWRTSLASTDWSDHLLQPMLSGSVTMEWTWSRGPGEPSKMATVYYQKIGNKKYVELWIPQLNLDQIREVFQWKFCGKPPCFMGKPMASCRFSSKK